jgi:anti-sigma factor RsiW
MFDCEKTQPLLSEFANAELSTPLLKQVERHLQVCAACRQDFATEMDILVNLGDLPLIKCPDQVTDNILARIEYEARPPRISHRRFWLLGTSSLAAAALALMILAPWSETTNSNDSYTNQEIRSATAEAQYALAKVAAVINQNEKSAFEQVFGQEIPGAVGGSLRHLTKNLQGEV